MSSSSSIPNNDSISILDRRTYDERHRIGLSLLRRFGRFKQVFESQFVDRRSGRCKLPQYTFTSTPDFSPYNSQPILFAQRANPIWRAMTRDVDFSRPDADEAKLIAAIMKSEGLPRPGIKATAAVSLTR